MSKTKTPPVEEADEDDRSNVSPTAKRLGSYIQRVEKLREDKKAIAEDEKTVFQEAKSAGFDTKVMREVIKRRAQDKSDVEEFDAMLANYETNLESVLD